MAIFITSWPTVAVALLSFMVAWLWTWRSRTSVVLTRLRSVSTLSVRAKPIFSLTFFVTSTQTIIQDLPSYSLWNFCKTMIPLKAVDSNCLGRWLTIFSYAFSRPDETRLNKSVWRRCLAPFLFPLSLLTFNRGFPTQPTVFTWPIETQQLIQQCVVGVRGPTTRMSSWGSMNCMSFSSFFKPLDPGDPGSSVKNSSSNPGKADRDRIDHGAIN